MSPFSPKIESAAQYIQGPYLAGHGDPNQNPTPRYHVWWWNHFQMKHNDETWSHLPWLITWNLRAAKPMWHVPGSTSHTQIQSISEKDSPSSAPPKNSSLEKQRRWHNIVVDAYLLQMELRSGTHGTMITPFKKGAGGRYWNPEMARLGMVSYWGCLTNNYTKTIRFANSEPWPAHLSQVWEILPCLETYAEVPHLAWEAGPVW